MTTNGIKTSLENLELTSDYLNRFSGIARLYGQSSLKILSQARVAVIGIGGVGSWTAEALGRTGVQNISLIDLDEVCVTNSNRQLHALNSSIGRLKVEVVQKRLQDINPEGDFKAVADFLTENTIEELIGNQFDVIIDAIDSLKNKTLLAVYCRDQHIPLVTVGGAGGKKDPTLIRTGDLSDSTQDNLLKRLKKKLRVSHDFPRQGPMGLQSVYSIERAVYPTDEGGTCFKKDLKDKSQAKLDCATGMGTASFGTGSFGFAAAKVAIDLLLSP
jgi:tRNA A37 threonylcarbamoyladenosine dehydratase